MTTIYQQAAQFIREKQNEPAEIIVARQYESQPAIWKPLYARAARQALIAAESFAK